MSRKGHGWETYIRRAENLGFTVEQGKNNRVIIMTQYGKWKELKNHKEFISWVINEEHLHDYLSHR